MKNNETKQNRTCSRLAVFMAIIILVAGLGAIGTSLWLQENEISIGVQEYEAMTQELKQNPDEMQEKPEIPDEDESNETQELLEKDSDNSETGIAEITVQDALIETSQQEEEELYLDDDTDLHQSEDEQPTTENAGSDELAVQHPIEQTQQNTYTGNTGANMEACKAANKDFIGWLQIPGTDVDYPVVLTADVDYYLDHTFNGKESIVGCLFSLDKTDYQTPSKNITVYGHHMRRSRATTMFQPLHNYKDPGFYAANKTINYDTLYGNDTYTVFAVINKRECDWDVSVADFASEADFQAFLDRAQEWALYNTGVNVTSSDHILTLVTCDRDYNSEDGQLVVMAVKD